VGFYVRRFVPRDSSVERRENMRRIRIFLIALAGLFFLSVTSQLFAQEDVIKKRKSLMKSTSKSVKTIKKAVKEKDYATVEAKAKLIAATMGELPSLFPKGSTSGKSRAKEAIWKDWEKFMRGAKSNKESNKEVAEFLAEAAAAKDGDQVATLVKGIDCRTCHKSFRKPKKKKKK
jgi:cytochrome c556